ncbi:PepSY domain-containing protein [Flavobacteriaceae bacterium F89]|uniref:PepSY domain-containing protein n=1 Tax=Cerina litoralis TaxID=2874477 RepID=A0AAE3ESW0_9FLAO|nr:PepSY domain-containing protein [Cerina litoralis]MCG2460373.1 PepSY domain-containing protein [Cerina litoralis]
MKNLKLLCVGGLMAGSFGYGQNVSVPQPVKDAFVQTFPTVKSVKWDKENSTEWEAEFRMKGKQYSANFLEDGTWKETEHVVKKKDIPSNIKKALDTEFFGYTIEESEISETREGSVYEFELEKGEQMMEVAIDNSGKVVKKESMDIKDKD